LGRRVFRVSVIGIFILCLVAMGAAYAQQKKVGGGDIKFEPKEGDQGPVTFRHEGHGPDQKLKCTDCHTKIFKMKKGDSKMAHAAYKEGKFCGTCHDGKKSFGTEEKADCGKCHKK
jgi:c(7)-type cytochrome triheme protein